MAVGCWACWSRKDDRGDSSVRQGEALGEGLLLRRVRFHDGLGLAETMLRHFPSWDEVLSARLVDNYRRLWRAEYKDRVALFPGSFAVVALRCGSHPLGRATDHHVAATVSRRRDAPLRFRRRSTCHSVSSIRDE